MNTRWTGNELVLSFDSTTKVVNLTTEETQEFEVWVLNRLEKNNMGDR
jgi:hypothetical protein